MTRAHLVTAVLILATAFASGATEFNAVWRNGPFSHVGLKRAEEPAANRLAALDTQRVGPDAVTLTWRDTFASSRAVIFGAGLIVTMWVRSVRLPARCSASASKPSMISAKRSRFFFN
jgi:hypothetical protein